MRYTGPKRKLERREQATIFGSDAWKKRTGLPGQHPVSRKRPSNFAIQFREKQKVKRMYLMTEKQFRRFFAEAKKATGNTGTRFLQLLELRLDNVVYRLGFAKTRNQARQFVNHGHVQVNGVRADIPSMILNVGDEVSLKSKFTKSPISDQIDAELKAEKHKAPEWLSKAKTSGKVLAEPTRDQMDKSIKEQSIVELYSR
ncbi:30S ribosomal protein S4 [Candidatus Dojkabacteria bacterium]|nr:30S ribosomal protein S4 [Candidatus Dojkabacteria bacterium]